MRQHVIWEDLPGGSDLVDESSNFGYMGCLLVKLPAIRQLNVVASAFGIGTV